MDGSSNSKPRLLLHFDINKTILIADPASGITMPQMLNSLLSECVWGRVDEEKKAWQLVSQEPSIQSPESGLMTYGRFLETVAYPLITGAERSINEGIKAMRRKMKITFTNQGQPGESFARHYEELLQALSISQEDKVRLAAEFEKQPSDPSLSRLVARLHADGTVFLLPSFFKLLLHLQHTKRDFALSLRTFGIDAAHAADEITAFASGTHPCYPGVAMDGRDGDVDLRMKFPERASCWYRTNDGTFIIHNVPEDLPRDGEDLLHFYRRHKETTLVDQWDHLLPSILHRAFGDSLDASSTSSSVDRLIQAQADCEAKTQTHLADIDSSVSISPKEHCMKSSRAFVLRDHYAFWAARAEAATAGKLLIVQRKNQQRKETPNRPVCHQIFFDDNIEVDDPHIVDARYDDGSSIPFAHSKNRYLFKAEPLGAIVDPNYFIKALEKCELNFANDED